MDNEEWTIKEKTPIGVLKIKFIGIQLCWIPTTILHYTLFILNYKWGCFCEF